MVRPGRGDAPIDEPVTAPRRITILGATGSIGTSTLAVIAERPEAFAVEAVTAHSNAEKLARVARALRRAARRHRRVRPRSGN